MSTFVLSDTELGMVAKALDYVGSQYPGLIPDPDTLTLELAASNRRAFEARYENNAEATRWLRTLGPVTVDREAASDPWPFDGEDGPARFLQALEALRYNMAEDPRLGGDFGHARDWFIRLSAAIAVLKVETLA